MTKTLHDDKAELVRERVLRAVAELLTEGDELTFARIARAAEVSERTVYRHFPNREALMAAVYGWANEQIGFAGNLPTDPAEMETMVRRVFPGFDTLAPVMDELLTSAEGRQARLTGLDARRSAAEELVEGARADLRPEQRRQLAAVVQVLGTASVWQALRDFWGWDGATAADAVALALGLLLEPTATTAGAADATATVVGVNHIAVLTDDLDRFVEFYQQVFDLEVVFTEDTPAFRHAILRAGPTSWLHPAEVPDNPHGAASAAMFRRGHLDHLALTAASLEAFHGLRERLLARGATDGAIDDLGAFLSFWCADPDDMRIEVVVILDPALQGIHEPRPAALA
jgi:AcrR family transcriptional regulator